MAKKTTIKPEETDQFLAAMKDVTPLPHQKHRLEKKPHAVSLKQSQEIKDETLALIMHEMHEVAAVESDTSLSYKHPSISHKILRNLQEAQYNVEARLDLHGMTVEKAHDAIAALIETAMSEDIKVLLIIHGKGYRTGSPILKNKVNQWLRSIAPVLAFCSAKAKHGGTGAVYVLLKSKQKRRDKR